MTTVEVAGPVTLAEVAQWRSALAGSLARSPGLRLDLAESGPWDLAGVQLLIATIASGKRAGQSIVLAHVPNVLTAVVERAALGNELSAITVD